MAAIAFTVDRRARVPFALIGVLLLTTSLAYSSGLASQGPIRVDRSVERAMDRANADATPAVRSSVRSAAEDAAREPVTRATDAGVDAVRRDSPFADALRIRIGLAAAERLPGASARVGDVTATPGLGGVHGAAPCENLTRLRERVEIDGVENGTALRVTLRNLTVVAERDGRRVASSTRNVTVTVATPVLAAHERTERFEARLDRGPTAGPGLGRQLTARLYPVVWARGYGQYAGAPVQNVLANRHVELSTNAGVLAVQRSTFGTDDERARRGVRVATAETGIEDLLAPTSLEGDRWSDVLLDGGAIDGSRPTVPPPDETPEPGNGTVARANGSASFPPSSLVDSPNASPADTATVEVGHSADVAFLEALDRAEEQFRRTYRVKGERTVRVVQVDATPVPDATPPAAPPPNASASPASGRSGSPASDSSSGSSPREWSLASEHRTTSHAVVDGWTRRGVTDATAIRTVERRTSVTRTWSSGDATRRTTATGTRTFRVRVEATASHAPTDAAPYRDLDAFADSGALGGSNLRDAGERAIDRLVDGDGGFDAIAVHAAESNSGEAGERGASARERVVVHADPPDRLRTWVAGDLRSLRERLRTTGVRVERGRIATGAAAPEASLARTVDDRRAAFVDAPASYDGVADRARVAVRAVYVDAVREELRRRADREAETGASVAESLADAGAPTVARLETVRRSRVQPKRSGPDRRPDPVGTDGPAGNVTFDPVGSPGYLPRTPIDATRTPALEGDEVRAPLSVRNVNYFTLPHGELAGGIVDRVLGTGRTVPLGQAGRTLAATNATLERASDPELRAARADLVAEVGDGMAGVHSAVDDVLREETDLSARERRAVVRAADRRYSGLGERAIAVENGSYADALAAAACERTGRRGTPGDATLARDELAVRLRVAVRDAAGREEAEIPDTPVTDASSRVRAIARKELTDDVGAGIERGSEAAREHWGNEVVAATPAGLPIAPVPGYWYATVNVWQVQVRGSYPRFAVHASGGTAHEGPLVYAREPGTVSVDVGGETVVLGETEPVEFRTRTAIAIAVPPGAGGVGDVDGVADERSPGWSDGG